jgi:hypothetical protein
LPLWIIQLWKKDVIFTTDKFPNSKACRDMFAVPRNRKRAMKNYARAEPEVVMANVAAEGTSAVAAANTELTTVVGEQDPGPEASPRAQTKGKKPTKPTGKHKPPPGSPYPRIA